MGNEPEKEMNQTPAAPGSQTSPDAPQRVVVNNGFDKLFFLFSIPFIVISLLVVSISVFFAVFGIPETRFDTAPDFVNNLTGDQYELIVHKLGPIDDNFFQTSKAYVLVRTDADVVSLIEQMDAPKYKFIPLDSPELETEKEFHQAKIDEVYREFAGTPPGADCRYFVTCDDPDYYNTYLCFSPESKLLLVVRAGRKFDSEKEND